MWRFVRTTPTVVDIPADAILPADYVREGDERLEIYRRIASIRSISDYRDVFDELTDRYGDLPAETATLLDISYIRAFGERAGFTRVSVSGSDVELILDKAETDNGLKMAFVSRLLTFSTDEQRLTFKAGYRPMILVSGAAKKNGRYAVCPARSLLRRRKRCRKRQPSLLNLLTILESRDSVTSSAYSSAAPIGMPRAMRAVRIPDVAGR